MKKFSDLGVKTHENKNIFAVPVISIEEITNCEIEVLDYESGVRTRHGDGRYIVKVKQDFPFSTTIKQQRFGSGSGKTFYFT